MRPDRGTLSNMNTRRAIALVCAALLVPFVGAAGITGCAANRGTTYALYFLGGQSNMEGYGKVSELPEGWSEPPANLYIYQPNLRNDGQQSAPESEWVPVTPGHGVGFSVRDGKPTPGERFGPELAFAHTIRTLDPGTPIAIVKYAKGGSSIDPRAAGRAGHWQPLEGPPNQYDHAVATLRAATTRRDVEGDGEIDRFVPAGIVWMQGETDGTNETTAGMYKVNLTMLMASLRIEMRDPDLPVVIGRISDSRAESGKGRVWQFGELVRRAQVDFAEQDENTGVVLTTDQYGYSDVAHYDTPGYLDLGRKMAEAMLKLQTERRR